MAFTRRELFARLAAGLGAAALAKLSAWKATPAVDSPLMEMNADWPRRVMERNDRDILENTPMWVVRGDDLMEITRGATITRAKLDAAYDPPLYGRGIAERMLPAQREWSRWMKRRLDASYRHRRT